MIRVRDLRVDYDNFCAVRDLNLDIKAGQVFGLIGPNGAGKTTTMRSILGLLEPTYGEIIVSDVDIRERPEDACRVIGFMPDFPPMYDDLVVWEFLDLFAACYYIPKRQRPDVIESHLRLVGLWDKRDSFVPELSRGMKQRLILAKTLIPDPQVLMLDEPASGLDPHGRVDLKNILKTLAQRGKTVLISSHILSEMSEFCTAVGIMERGRMVISGTVEEVTRQVMGAAVLVIEILDKEDAFRSIISRDKLAGPVHEAASLHFEFSYDGEPEHVSALLHRLVTAGIPIVAFGRRKEGLEEVFLKVGAKEVS
ncbi:MAG: ABC transporter ATP-binding protein [Planctomycetes bacterium]|nr:ABC transporter ATP-binding protein [Planctomycetota bacterium]